MDNIANFIVTIIWLAFSIFMIASYWRLFEKAGHSGILAIIPVANIFTLVKIADREWWWILLMLIPVVNFFVYFILWNDIAERFEKGLGFGLGLVFLNPIFVAILAWGDARYYGGRKKKYAY